MTSPYVNAVRELNERLNRQLSSHTNGHASTFKSEHTRLMRALEGLDSIRSNPDVTAPEAAHALKVSKAAARLKEEAQKAKSRAYDAYMNYSTQLSGEIIERAGIKENKYASEIRAAFMQLDNSKRMKFISEVIEKRDGASFAAIIDAPEILTGLSSDMRQQFTESYYSKVAPELLQQQNELKEAMDLMDATFRAVGADVDNALNPSKVREIQLNVQKSMEASELFTNALGSSI